ncbi:MAG: hypothetical protein RL689_1644 [Planctomycetota bacterium]|jgi:hypothetical protein
MMNLHARSRRSLAAGLLPLALATAASAQPSVIMLGMGGSDMTPDGNTVAGTFYDASTRSHPVCTWTRGVGLRRTPGAIRSGLVRASATANELSYNDYNYENKGNFSYRFPGMFNETSIAHRWSSASGSFNLGPAANGARCDYNINTAFDISGNGRYVVGGGWTSGLCGPYRAFRHDATTATFNQLPITISRPPASAPSRANRANGVSDDGRVICGYDENYDPELTFVSRHAVVWYRNATDTAWTTHVLDPYGGEAFVVSGDGSSVFGTMSDITALATFGVNVESPVRWRRNGTEWVPQLLGVGLGDPVAASTNGEIAVGGNFYWNSAFNGGVAMDIQSFLQSRNVPMTGLTPNSPVGPIMWGVSDDGNTLLVRVDTAHDPCLATGGLAMVRLDTVPCEPPRLNLGPISDTTFIASTIEHPYGAILNTFASGTWPLNYQWQKRDEATDQWVDLVNDQDCWLSNPAFFDLKAVNSPQLRIGYLSGAWAGDYRCVVSNACGTLVSPVATVAPPFCPADFNGDGGVDGADVEAFFDAWTAGDQAADVNLDGGVDGTDVETFFTLWTAGGC